MKEFHHIIQKSPLFHGFTGEELGNILGCLSANVKEYGKNQTILHSGDSTNSVGMMLTGSANIVREDFWGNSNIIANLLPGNIFAESYACTGSGMQVSVEAKEKCKVLFLNVRCIAFPCSSACDFHSRLIRNLLSVLARKNLQMNEKLSHMAQRSTREKLLSYLSAESIKQNDRAFDIPFNRQQLADYLAVDRSAMCTEMGKMRDEGIISFDKNHFVLYDEI